MAVAGDCDTGWISVSRALIHVSISILFFSLQRISVQRTHETHYYAGRGADSAEVYATAGPTDDCKFYSI